MQRVKRSRAGRQNPAKVRQNNTITERMIQMEKHIIVMLNWNKEVCKKIRFIGSYYEARKMADKILYSDEKYWAYRVEIA